MTKRRGKSAPSRAASSDRATSADAGNRDSGGQAPVPAPGADDAVAITPVEEMDLVGGAVCLDLVNTGAGRRLGPFREKLNGYGDLVTWGERVASIDEAGGAELRKAAERMPPEAQRVLDRARALREAIYRVFSTLASPAPADLDLIALEGARAVAARRLVSTPEGIAFQWRGEVGLERPLLPAALSAVELLTAGDVSRVKECASENCNWLFVDESRNRSRRWCDMKDCGNRAKARRFRQRSRPR